MTRRADPVTRDYLKARRALPVEQREVWGAPVRDGTCADEGDECEACRCAPPPPATPLVQGGQGRDDASTSRAADIFAVCITIAAVLLAVALAVASKGVVR